jgi:hypothetical protein
MKTVMSATFLLAEKERWKTEGDGEDFYFKTLRIDKVM